MKDWNQTLAAQLGAILILITTSWADGAVLTWTNISGGNWSNPANWSPHQVPTNVDTALITLPGTYVVNYDFTNYVTTDNDLPSVAEFTLGAGVNGGGTQTLLVSFPPPNTYGESGELLVNNELLVTNGGVLQITNGFVYAKSLTIDKGGALNGVGEYVSGNWLVENGGSVKSMVSYFAGVIVVTNNGSIVDTGQEGNKSTTFGPTTIERGGTLSISNSYPSSGGFTIGPGGTINIVAGALTLYDPMNNAGTVNLTNGTLGLFGYDDVAAAGVGSLNNLSGGIINLQGASLISGVGENGTNGWLTNSGTILASGSNTISLSAYIPFDPPYPVLTTPPVLDNTHGTITNFSGTLTIGAFNTNISAGVYYGGPATVTKFSGGNVVISAGYGYNGYIVTPCEFDPATLLEGPGQFEFAVGGLYLPGSVPHNFTVTSSPNGVTTLELGPGFQGGTITNLALAGDSNEGQVYGDVLTLLNTNNQTVSGTFNITNAGVITNLIVTSGGIINAGGASLAGVTITAGGRLNASNTVVGTGSIAHGGTVNFVGGTSIIDYSFTNSGIVNISNSVVDLYYGGILNQSGGVINLIAVAQIVASLPADYLINQGIIVNNGNAGITNGIYGTWNLTGGPYYSGLFNFNTSQGVITNLSGILLLPGFQTNLTGAFYTAAGALTQFGAAGSNFTQINSGLQLSGPGQNQFIAGNLYLPNNTVSNLALAGGILEIGPSFQGGAITNLTLGGTILTNTSSGTTVVSGPFTIINEGGSYYVTNDGETFSVSYPGGLYGNYLVISNGDLALNNSAAYGAVAMTNGGTANLIGAILNGPVTMEKGGQLNGIGYSEFYAPLTVQPGGTLNYGKDDFNEYLYVNSTFTNAGTLNLTNTEIYIYNDGSATYSGSFVNQSGAIFNVRDTNGDTFIYGSGATASFVNAGTINYEAGPVMLINTAAGTNSGSINNESGAGIYLCGQWTLLPSSSLNISLFGPTNYGSFYFSTNLPEGPTQPAQGNIDLAGTFNVTLGDGYVPGPGTSFDVLTYGSASDGLSGINLPAAVKWQSVLGATNLELTVSGSALEFTTHTRTGNNLIFSGTGGTPAAQYYILASTNLALPLADWTRLATNKFDANGNFSYTNGVGKNTPREFFILKH